MCVCKPSVSRFSCSSRRCFYSALEPDLKTTFMNAIAEKKELFERVKAVKGERVDATVKVRNIIGGMRCA